MCMKIPALLAMVVATAAFCFAGGTFVFDSLTWDVPERADWKVDTSAAVPELQLLNGKEPPSNLPRRPMQFALAQTEPFGSVTVEADIMPLARSVIIVYDYQNPAHFNYAHLSTDTGTKQPVHNGIFHVYGGERVRISNPAGPPAFPQTQRWYHVKLTVGGDTGAVTVLVDGKQIPALSAVDVSLKQGRVGLGSFDETGKFRNIKISGQRAAG
jgi:hypothetical protein